MRPIEPVRASEIDLVDAHYVRRTVLDSWEELPALLAGALVVALAGFPVFWLALNRLLPLACLTGVVLLAPAWAAYCYLAGRNGIGRKPHLAALPAAFVHFYLRSCALAGPAAVLLLLALLGLPLLATGAPALALAGIILQALVLSLYGLLLVHALPLLALFDLPLARVYANSLVLLLRWPMVPVGLLSMVVLLGVVVRWLGLGALPLLPLVFTPFQVNATLMLARRALEGQGR